MWDKAEVEAYKQLDLVDFAVARGYEIDRKESWKGSKILRSGADKICVRREEDGHWVYFSFSDGRDNGTIFDFLKFRGGGMFMDCLKYLREWTGRPAPFMPPKPQKPTGKITEEGQPCRHCGTPVRKTKEKRNPKKRNPGGYYYAWSLLCPACHAIYLQPEAKRFYDAPAAVKAAENDAYDRAPAEAMLPKPDPHAPVDLSDRYVPWIPEGGWEAREGKLPWEPSDPVPAVATHSPEPAALPAATA